MMLDKLTAREVEVLLLVAQGKNTEEIAKATNTSFENIKSHRAKILQKMAARNMAQAIHHYHIHYIKT